MWRKIPFGLPLVTQTMIDVVGKVQQKKDQTSFLFISLGEICRVIMIHFDKIVNNVVMRIKK